MLSYFQDSIFSSLKLLFQSKCPHSVVIDDSGIFQSNGIKSRGGDAKKLNKKEQEVECR